MSERSGTVPAQIAQILADIQSAQSLYCRPPDPALLARRTREERLDGANPAITDKDRRDIIHDRLKPFFALRAVRSWTARAFGDDEDAREDLARFLVLWGPMSAGKTVAAVWAIANYGGVYITAGELKRVRFSRNAQDIETLRRAHGARFLVLDDLGGERADEMAGEALFELINERQNRRFTIVTTNLDPDRVSARYGENAARAVARIMHQGGFLAVPDERLRNTGNWQVG